MKFNIPNVKSLRIIVIGFDKALLKFGIERKLRKLVFEKDANSRINRYLAFQFKRLSVADPKLYWKVADLLLTRSKALRLLALRNERPNWYKNDPIDYIIKTMRKLNGLCYRPRSGPIVKITYLPKPQGGHRVIAAPTLEMRCYLWIMNTLLAIFIESRLNPSQHGHRRGKGVGSCWIDILRNFSSYNYIFEFDYYKFHDIIRREYLLEALESFDIPKEWTERLVNNLTVFAKPDSKLNPKEDFSKAKYAKTIKGVPQGGNTSAILGMICLEHLRIYEFGGKYIGYADDGLLFMNDPELVDQFRAILIPIETGIRTKAEKCGWVKFDGKWVKNLQFVGCELVDGRLLKAKTHSGKEKSMLWPSTRDRLREFTSSNFAPIEEARASCQKYGISKEIRLDWETGWNRFNFLLAKIFGGLDKKPSKVLKWIEGSVLHWIPHGLRARGDIVTASSLTFEWLRKLIEADEKISQRMTKRNGKSGIPATETKLRYQYISADWNSSPWVPSINRRPYPRTRDMIEGSRFVNLYQVLEKTRRIPV